METINNQLSHHALQSGSVDYAAALRQYQKYGRGRSTKLSKLSYFSILSTISRENIKRSVICKVGG